MDHYLTPVRIRSKYFKDKCFESELLNMDRKYIVRKFLEMGYLLTPEALEFLEKNKNIEKILETFHSKNFIITIDELTSFEVPKIDRIKILKNILSFPDKLKKNDFLKFYLSRYEQYKKIIEERISLNFTSISSLKNGMKDVSIISMIHEIKESDSFVKLLVDDPTGEIIAIVDKKIYDELVNVDDVLVLTGDVRMENGKAVLEVKKILWPDVPLRSPIKGYGRICVISDLHLDEAPISSFINFLKWFNEQDIKYLFVLGDLGDIKKFEELINEHLIREKIIFTIPGERDEKRYPGIPIHFENENIVSLSNPSLVELNGVKILLIHKFDRNMIKKRCLGKPNYILEKDFLVLDEIPDLILFGHTHNQEITNYKSITIVNPGSLLTEFVPTIIDLETRNYEQRRF